MIPIANILRQWQDWHSKISNSKPGRRNVDSGTTNCLVPANHPVLNPSSSSLSIRTAKNAVMKALQKGSAQSPIPGLSSLKVHSINGLVELLLSVSDITDSDIGVVFLPAQVVFINQLKKLESLIINQCKVLAEGLRVGRLYYVGDPTTVSTFQASQTSNTSILTWHHQLSHLGI